MCGKMSGPEREREAEENFIMMSFLKERDH